MDTVTVWVVGKYRGGLADGSTAWELRGIFAAEQSAVAACAEAVDFVAPVVLDEALPQTTSSWPGLRYPLGLMTWP